MNNGSVFQPKFKNIIKEAAEYIVSTHFQYEYLNILKYPQENSLKISCFLNLSYY